MKRTVAVFLLGGLLSVLLLACAPDTDTISTVTLIEDVSYDPGNLICLYQYEEGMISERYLTETSEQEALVDQINAAEAVRVEKPEVDKLTGPLYGLQVPQTNHGYGDRLIVGWQDGYWFAENGSVYRVELDFERILTDYPWMNESSGVEAEEHWGVNLANYGGKWYPGFLAAEAKRSGNQWNPWPEPTTTEYAGWMSSEEVRVTLEYDEYPAGTEEFDCRIQNNSEDAVSFIPEIEVEVYLEGEWKSLEDKHHTPYSLLIRTIGPEDECTEIVDLDRSAWDFMPGRYRICVEYGVGDLHQGWSSDHAAVTEFEIVEE